MQSLQNVVPVVGGSGGSGSGPVRGSTKETILSGEQSREESLRTARRTKDRARPAKVQLARAGLYGQALEGAGGGGRGRFGEWSGTGGISDRDTPLGSVAGKPAEPELG